MEKRKQQIILKPEIENKKLPNMREKDDAIAQQHRPFLAQKFLIANIK